MSVTVIAEYPVSNLDSALAIIGIAQVATGEQLAAMVLGRTVDDIKRAVRASVYWVEFVRLAEQGKVPADFAGPGIISRCVLDWAHADAGTAMGMTWWNGLSHAERTSVLAAAAGELRREPSAAEAWELWRQGKIRCDGQPATSRQDRRSWIGKRVIVYSGPHYGKVHQVTGTNEAFAHLYHSTSGDRYSVPFCDLEEVGHA